MGCLFCNEPEKSYTREVDFICSRCVLLLADADQADFKKAYQQALNKGYLRKASALESFIMGDEQHGKRPDKSIKRNFNRERTARPIRNEKRLSEPIET